MDPRRRRTCSLQGWPLRYGLAFVAVGLAWASRERLLPESGDRSPFLAFGLAVLVTALAGGFGPGLLAMILASVVAVLFYLPPYLVLSVHSPFDFVQLGLFTLEGLVAATAGEIVRRALAREERLGRAQARFVSFLENAERLRGLHGGASEPLVEGLTERELEVARLLALGLGNDEISRTMFLSRNTVKTHLKHIYEKLAVGTRTEAVARCIETGLLEAPPAESAPAVVGAPARGDEGRVRAELRRTG